MQNDGYRTKFGKLVIYTVSHKNGANINIFVCNFGKRTTDFDAVFTARFIDERCDGMNFTHVT